MNATTLNLRWTRPLLAGTVAALATFVGALAPVRDAGAVDTEVFFSDAVTTLSRPNVLFIVDTSSSMFTVTATQSVPYDSATSYTATGCTSANYYVVKGTTVPTSCSAAGVIMVSAANFRCGTSRGVADGAAGFATITNKVAQETTKKVKGVTTYSYIAPTADNPTFCQNESVSPTPNPNATINWNDPALTNGYAVYKGNYLAYRVSGSTKSTYRIDVMREALYQVALATPGVNFGLMRLDLDGTLSSATTKAGSVVTVTPNANEGTKGGNGAMVVMPVTDISSASGLATLRFKLGLASDGTSLPWSYAVAGAGYPDRTLVTGGGGADDVPLFIPGGKSSLAGAMVEAYYYFAGAKVFKGAEGNVSSQHPYNSVGSSLAGACADLGDGNTSISNCSYKSPITDACAKNYIVILSDGTTEQDVNNDTEAKRIIGNANATASTRYVPPAYDTPASEIGKTNLSCYTDVALDDLTKPSVPASLRLSGPGMCVDDMAYHMANRPFTVAGLTDKTTVATYTIGFQLGENAVSTAAEIILDKTAKAGNGKFFRADTPEQLVDTLGKALRLILVDNATFTSPAVTVNAFNRTQNLNDLYMSLFRPDLTYRWEGNLKKYRLREDGTIIDVDAVPAIDASTGFFKTTATSYWSDTIDGADITQGGAASRLPLYSARNLYTNLVGSDLTATGNALSQVKTLADSTKAALTGVLAGDTVTADELVDWAYGKDVQDANENGVTDENRYDMGDPLHSKPVTVIYGIEGSTTEERLQDGAIFVLTNDGFLHAFDPQSGDEYWSFIPKSLLPRLRNLFVNDETGYVNRGYGLDGVIRLYRVDNNRDGIIEKDGADGIAGNADDDKVYLFFGERRDGSQYYAVDVTDKRNPKLLWEAGCEDMNGNGTLDVAEDVNGNGVLDSGEDTNGNGRLDPGEDRNGNGTLDCSYPGLGQAWSMPQPGKVKIDTGSGGEEKLVLFLGGGYSTAQDQQPYATDTVGKGVYMVDALTGTLLWRAGGTGSGANLVLSDMTHAIPGDIKAIDITGDGFVDRLYASDLGGRIWRFDIYNGKSVTGSEGSRLVEGGLLASLGNAEDSTKDQTNTLRFYYSPDPALVTLSGKTFINVAIGAGHRELPARDLTTVNWFFSMRDYNLFQQLTSSQYKASCAGVTTPCHQVIHEGDLADLTSVVGTAATTSVPLYNPGWRVRLTHTGEKVLAESRTFQGSVYFTTYTPEARTGSAACAVAFGRGRLYAVSALDARPITDRDGIAGESTADRVKELQQATIPPEVVFVFPSPDNPDCVGQACRPKPVCLVGLESCGSGFGNSPVRTFWRQRGVN